MSDVSKNYRKLLRKLAYAGEFKSVEKTTKAIKFLNAWDAWARAVENERKFFDKTWLVMLWPFGLAYHLKNTQKLSLVLEQTQKEFMGQYIDI